MKRILFLFIVFVFTTAGFFKSALEECADIAMKDAPQFNKTAETERIKLTPKESNEQRRLRKIAHNKCDLQHIKKKDQKRNIGHDICILMANDNYNINYKSKIIRNISPEQNQKAYKKFISRSLKKKMNDTFSGYSHDYSECVKYKKNYPEMFKAKYD